MSSDDGRQHELETTFAPTNTTAPAGTAAATSAAAPAATSAAAPAGTAAAATSASAAASATTAASGQHVNAELDALARRADALRAAIARARADLEAAKAEEQAIAARLAELQRTGDGDERRVKRQESTALTTGVLHRLERREAWKVALAGAAAATLLGATILGIDQLAFAPAEHASTIPFTTPAPALPVVTPAATASIDNEPSAPSPHGVVIGASLADTHPSPPPTTTAAIRRRRPAMVAPPTDEDDPNASANMSGAPLAAPNRMGALTVVCLPKCDAIFDNGVPIGPGHVFHRPVIAGRHVLVLTAPNGARKSLTVEVTPEQVREIRVAMDAPRTANARNDKTDVF